MEKFCIKDPKTGKDIQVEPNNKEYSELSKVFFKPEIAAKYRFEPSKYLIRESSIENKKDGWILQSFYATQNNEYFYSYLYDLSLLPEDELKYMKLYNVPIPPLDGKANKLATRRDFFCSFEDFPRDKLFSILKKIHETKIKIGNEELSIWNPKEDFDRMINNVQLPAKEEYEQYRQNFLGPLAILVIECFRLKAIKKWHSYLKLTEQKNDGSLTLLKQILEHLKNKESAESIIKPIKELQKAKSSRTSHGGKKTCTEVIKKSQYLLNKVTKSLEEIYQIIKHIHQSQIKFWIKDPKTGKDIQAPINDNKYELSYTYFNKKVLDKYKTNEIDYDFDDNNQSITNKKDKWTIHSYYITSNNKYIYLPLCVLLSVPDQGQACPIPEKELTHWKNHNIKPPHTNKKIKFLIKLKTSFSPKNIKIYYPILIIFSFLILISVLFSYKIDSWIILNEITNNVLIGFALYFALTHIPQAKEKKAIKENIASAIFQQKTKIILTLLIAANLQKHNNKIKKLTDIKKFKAFFKKDDRWYTVYNGLYGNKNNIAEILDNLEEIVEIMKLSLPRTKVASITVFNSIIWLSSFIKKSRKMDFDYDDFKTFTYGLYCLLSSYSWIEGYTNKDPIQEMLKKI